MCPSIAMEPPRIHLICSYNFKVAPADFSIFQMRENITVIYLFNYGEEY